MTRGEALAAAARRLAEAGIAGAARDARLLLAHAAGLPPDAALLDPAAALAPADEARFRSMVAARARRQPLAQITGTRLFWGRAFRVTPEVLDPRPETETLVAAALEQPFARVLDLGTGSGCILLSVLAERPGASGTGVDLSPAALAVAAANRAALGLEARAELLAGDWFAPVAGRRYDLILSNPPYLAEAEIAALSPEVRDWEPRMALTPGGDGLAAYRAIAAGAGAHLAPGGRIALEVGAGQGPAVAAILAAAGLQGVEARRDLDGRERVILARS